MAVVVLRHSATWAAVSKLYSIHRTARLAPQCQAAAQQPLPCAQGPACACGGFTQLTSPSPLHPHCCPLVCSAWRHCHHHVRGDILDDDGRKHLLHRQSVQVSCSEASALQRRQPDIGTPFAPKPVRRSILAANWAGSNCPCHPACPCRSLGLMAFYGFFIGSILVRSCVCVCVAGCGTLVHTQAMPHQWHVVSHLLVCVLRCLS